MKKICSKCKKTKIITKFWKDKINKDGHRSWCKSCDKKKNKKWYTNNHNAALQKAYKWKNKNEQNKNKAKTATKTWVNANKSKISKKQREWYLNNRDIYLQNRYNITLKEYNLILKQQNNVCAICRQKRNKYKFLSVDHDHETGKIRGLLCGMCNAAIGLFREDIIILEDAIKYLRNKLHPEEKEGEV